MTIRIRRRNPSSWRRYLENSHAKVLRGLATELGGKMQVRVCECGASVIREKLERQRIADPDQSLIAMFVDAALLAAVHTYEREYYERCLEHCSITVYVGNHGSCGMSHPQALLLGVREWTPRHKRMLRTALQELLPQWCRRHDEIVMEAGAGHELMRRLAEDRDIAFGFHGALPDAVVEAYRKEFRGAEGSGARYAPRF